MNRLIGALAGVALATLSASASTNIWTGNTDANWGTSGNWTFSHGSGPVASGDSLVFGAAGASGTSLNNDIASLSVNNLTFSSGASAFTFGGNAFTLTGNLTDAASVGENLNGIAIGSGAKTAIKNTGSGTLALGALSESGGGTVRFSISSPISTSTIDYGMLGGWAVIDNGNNTYDWAHSGSSGVIIAPTYVAPTGGGDLGNVKCTTTTSWGNHQQTWNSILVSGSGVTLNMGAWTMFLNSGGIILQGGATLTGNSGNLLKCNSGNPFFVHVPDSGTIGNSLADNGSATALYKDGPGTLTLSGANTYTGGTMVYEGTLIQSTATTSAGGYVIKDGATLGVSGSGTLKMSALTLGNCTNNFSSISTTAAIITNTGALTLAGTVTVNVSGSVIPSGQYPLINSASITGAGGFAVGSLPSGAVANIATNGNTIVLNVTFFPPPAAPTGLAVTATGNAYVQLSWNSSSDATSYNVKRGTVSGTYPTISNVTGTTFTDTGLVNGTPYYYVVSAVSAAGEGTNSSEISATSQAVAPATPVGLVAASGSTSVTLNWNTVLGATGCLVKRSTTNGGPYTVVANPAGTSYVDTGLAYGTTYYYVVSATNSAGQSADSLQASATTATSASTTLVHRYSFTESSGTSMADSIGGPAWNGTLPNGGTWSGGKLNLAAASQQYVALPGGILSNYTAVTIDLWASFGSLPNACFLFGFGNINGTQGQSYIFCQPKIARIAITPSNYSGEQRAEGNTDWSGQQNLHITAVFDPPTRRLALYTNGVLMVENIWVTVPMSSVNDVFSYIGRSLYSGDSYFNFTLDEVRIHNGAMSASEIAEVQPLGPDQLINPPAAPAGLAATAGYAQTALRWNASAGAASYIIKRRTAGGVYTTIANVTGTAFNDTGLVNGTAYFYVVSAANGGGAGANSTEVSVTPQAVPPAAPAGLVAKGGNTQVSLNWNAAFGASGYVVKRATTNGGPYTVVTNLTAAGFVDAGLANGTTYYYVVSATNPAGESTNSLPASVQPMAYLPLFQPGGFLFITFTGESSPLTEQGYLGLSQDGLHWTALNGGRLVMASTVGTLGVRDLFLVRSKDGQKVYAIATDLSVVYLNNNWTKAQTAGSHSIVVWESSDLVNWSQPRLAEVAATDAGCTWAPEAIYDATTGDFLVMWASKNAFDNYGKQRIWACRTTDFRTFGTPFIYVEKSNHVIDVDIVKDGDKFHRFTKDESHSWIVMETSDALLGTWTEVPGFTVAGLGGLEGPECFMMSPGKWSLMTDHLSGGAGYQQFVTTDIASGAFTLAGTSYPFRFRHGSVLPITSEEYARLSSGFNPVAYPYAQLSFNETSGASAADVSGHGWNGTLVNGASLTNGLGGKAVSLNGVNGYVSLPGNMTVPLGDFTISTWVKLNSVDMWSRIFDFGSGTSYYMFLSPKSGMGGARFAIKSGSAAEQDVDATAPIPANAWTHVAVSRQGNWVVLYVNGTPVGTNASMTTYPSQLRATWQNWLGRSQFSGDPYLNGVIDDFRIYSVGLSAGDIQSLYSGSVGAVPSPWQDQDLGTPGLAGSAGSIDSGNLVLAASGNGIQGTADQAHFLYQPRTNDAVLTVRLDTVSANSVSSASAGILFREGLSPSGRCVYLGRTQSGSLTWMHRDSVGGAITAITNVVSPDVTWLRVARAGNVFCAFQSLDGATWNPVGAPVPLSFPATFNLGVAMSSGANPSIEAARFSNLSISGQVDYQQWKIASGLATNIADDATGADGVPVLMKYALGHAPGAAATPAFVPVAASTPGVGFTRLSPAPVQYVVQASSNLVQWLDIATLAAGADIWTGPATVVEDASATPRKVTVTHTPATSQVFYRLQVRRAVFR
jgi:autotransporter-associated beta strand protein